MNKICIKCGKKLSIKCFSKGNDKFGLHTWCKVCEKIYRTLNKDRYSARSKTYYNKNKTELAKKAKKYYKTNKKLVAIRCKKYRESHKEQLKKWRNEHKYERKQWSTQWKNKNKEQYKKYQKEYRLKNRKHLLEINRTYRHIHKKEYIKYRQEHRKDITKYLLKNKDKLKKYFKRRNKIILYTNNNRCLCGKKITNSAKLCKLCNATRRGAKIYTYKGIKMRSSWEVAYAKYLDKQCIEWQYEPKTFNLGKQCNYTPDFYLSDLDTYAEIKGYWHQNSKQKYLKFRRKFCNIKLLNEQRLRKLGVI
jgi:flagellar hook protein FlgE